LSYVLSYDNLWRASITRPFKSKYRADADDDGPSEPMRFPAPGWRGVTIVPADGGGGDGGSGVTIVPDEMATPMALSQLLKRALSGDAADAAARRVTVSFRLDVTATESRHCAARFIQVRRCKLIRGIP